MAPSVPSMFWRGSPSSRASPRHCRPAPLGGKSAEPACAGSRPSVGVPKNRSTREKSRCARLVARAESDPAWGLEYEDETWFVWVPPAGGIEPEDRPGGAEGGGAARD